MRELRHREHEHEVEEEVQWRDLVLLVGRLREGRDGHVVAFRMMGALPHFC
jgi:hypothetical protein